MEDFFDRNNAKAFVYLLSESDNKNKIYVSEDKLLVIRKSVAKVYSLSDLSRLKTETKKMLFPLIVGGILTPFAFVSFFVNLFMPWIHLISILGGILLFYLGWAGKSVLTIIYKDGDELIYYLPSVSKNLQAFIDFINLSLLEDPVTSLGKLIYFELDLQYVNSLFGKSAGDENQIFPLYGYTYNQIVQSGKSINKLIAIDPSKAGIEIKFLYDPKSDLMRPTVEKPVLPESKIVIDTSIKKE